MQDEAQVPGYDGNRRRLSLVFLIAANLLPIAGVLLFDWDVASLVILYWSENLVIGFYNLLKMATAHGLRAVYPGLFFLFHYGAFCAVHGLFIVSLLLDQDAMREPTWPFLLAFLEMLLNVIELILLQAPPAWIIAFIGLMISHGYSFVSNFLLAGERYRVSIGDLMSAPYRRIVALHVAIIAGGFGIVALGQPLVLLLALVVLKTAIDIKLHQREHARAAAR